MFERTSLNRIGTQAVYALIALMLVSSTFAGVAAAQQNGDSGPGSIDGMNFLCNNKDAKFVQFVSTLVNLIFFGSFALGIVSYIVGKAAESDALNMADNLPIVGNIEDSGDAKEAVGAAFGLPVGVWFLTFLGKAIFGYNLSCIMPFQ